MLLLHRIALDILATRYFTTAALMTLLYDGRK
jgi:hypothetical protein